MKPVRALVALFAIAFAAPLSAQPGIDDPELMAWMQSANAAQQARLEALASRGDVESVLMAMTLVHPLFPLREDPEREIAAEQARAWALLERAAKADPEHPVVAWKLATCPADSGLAACGSPATRERLEAVGGARAEVQLWLAQVAQAIGDEAAVGTHLQAAAEAPRFSAFEDERTALIWEAWEGIEFPQADAKVVRSYRQHIEIDPEAFVAHLVSLAVVPRLELPNFSTPIEFCGIGGSVGDPKAPRRRQCQAIFTTMGEDKPTLLQRIVADQAMVELTADGPEADTWRARLRATAWFHEAGLPLTASLSTRYEPEHFATWREAGEYQALRELMHRRGVDVVPPDGWWPGNERMRALLGEGESARAGHAADTQPE